jgi:hypothetical protein
VRKTLREQIRIGFVHHRLEPVTDEIDRAGRRIGGGIIVASLVISASVVAVLSEGPAFLAGLPGLSWAGFIVAAFIGIRLFRRQGNGK